MPSRIRTLWGDWEARVADSDDDEAEDAADGEDGEGAPKKKLKLKTLLLLGGLPALVLILGGAAGAMFLMGKSKHADAETAEQAGEGGEPGHGGHGAAADADYDVVFYELPEMLVNISSEDGRAAYLKLKLTLEVDSEETVEEIEPAMPRVLDRFQGFLRELRVEDLNGSLGSYRLRLELLRRVNLAVAPLEVRAVLIEEMLVQ